jgi:hypothetical protein
MKEFGRTWTFDIRRVVGGTLGILGTLDHFRHLILSVWCDFMLSSSNNS